MFGKGRDNPNWKGGISSSDGYNTSRSRAWRLRNLENEAVRNSEWRKRNPEKVRAYGLLHYYIKTGKIVRMPCEICGLENAHAHHDDYNEPLKVRWLCSQHHREFHTAM